LNTIIIGAVDPSEPGGHLLVSACNIHFTAL